MSRRIPREVLSAEKRLPALATALELPIERLSDHPPFVAVGLGRRGWTLYRGRSTGRIATRTRRFRAEGLTG